jgi:hypothetical protein
MNIGHQQLYRNYYLHHFKLLHSMIYQNHMYFIELNRQIHFTNEMIRFNRQEYVVILRQQEMWYKLQHNMMTYLIKNTWKMIDNIDKSCFPNIDFNYESDFRNVEMLLQLLYQIITNKIE